MRLNFRKISALASSALMLGMTAGIAAAANYPAPFVSGGVGDFAVVYGANAAPSDVTQATTIANSLKSLVTTSGAAAIGSESYNLWTTSQKIYLNDSISGVRSSLTSTQMPGLLKDVTFDGNVNAKGTQRILLNTHPRVQFGQHPTSDDDPKAAVVLGTSAANHIYNATITFDRAVNFTHSDSIGQPLNLFGERYTVGSGSTKTDLVLFKSSQTVQLGIGSGSANPSSTTVTIDGKTYTVALISATSNDANIKVTDSNGVSETRTIKVGESKRVRGLDVAVDNAFSSQAQGAEGATLLIGTDRLKLTDGSEVRIGSDEKAIEGTKVVLGSGTDFGNVTSITFQVYAKDSDSDAIASGGSFVDPIFKSFQINFVGLKESSAEVIDIRPSSNDKATVKFTNHAGNEKTFNWYYNVSAPARLGDSTGNNISSIERAQVAKDGYLVLGTTSSKGEQGYLLKVVSIQNASTTSSDDYVEFRDEFSGKTYKSQTPSSEGTATISIEGTDYTVTYSRPSGSDGTVRVNSPQSSGNNLLIYQTIETSKGAKLGFYEPVTIDLSDYDGSGTDVAGLMFPNGNGFTTATLTYHAGNAAFSQWNVTAGGTTTTVNTTAGGNANVTVGRLTYTLTGTGTNTTRVNLRESSSGPLITLPALVLFEEEDGAVAGTYEAAIVKMAGAGTSDSKVTVSDVLMTWDQFGFVQMRSDTNIYKKMDKWGTLVTHDRSTSGQYSATISYPDEQAYAEVLVSSTDTSTGTTGGDLGGVLVKDTEVASVSSKNLIVVGGSCINTAAASLLGVPPKTCGSAWTAATGVGSGQFLIKGFSSSKLTNKLALLVAGWEAEDTANAATYLRTKDVDTSKAYKGTSATQATLITSAA